MKFRLPRLLSFALPLGALSSLGLAHAQSSAQLTTPPMIPGRTPVVVTPTTGTAGALATCLPAIQDQSGAGCIQASSVPTLGDLLPLSPLFNVTPVGDVGIGTTAPAAKLHVAGTSRLGGRVTVTGSAPIGQAGSGIWINGNDNGPLFPPGTPELGIRMFNNSIAPGQSTIQAWDYSINTGRDLVINDAGGRVGVGTSLPTEKLDVAGNIKIRTLDRLYFGTPTENGDPVYLYRQNGAFEESTIGVQLGNDAGGIDRFEIYGAGLLMRVWGNGSCQNTTGAWTVLSDRRLKKNIEPLQGSLEKLLQLEGVHFEYNEKAEAGSPSGVRTGFIAQDVEQVFPEWVSTAADGTKALTIQGFEALAVESLREQQTEIDGLREKNAELEVRVARLESVEQEVASLKAALATLVENR